MQTQLEKIKKRLKRKQNNPIKIIQERRKLLTNPMKNQQELDRTLKILVDLINHPEPFIPNLLFKAVRGNDFAVAELLCKSDDSLKYIQYTKNKTPFAPFILAVDSLQYCFAILMLPTLTQCLKNSEIPEDVDRQFRLRFNILYNFLNDGFIFSSNGPYITSLKVILDHAQEWITDNALFATINYLIDMHRLEDLKELFPHGKKSFISGKTYNLNDEPVYLASISVWNELTHFENPAPSILMKRLEILLYMIEDIPQNIPHILSFKLAWAQTKLLDAMNQMKSHPDFDKAFSKGMECFEGFVKIGVQRKWDAMLENNPLHFAVKYEQKEATRIILSTLPFNESLLHMNSEMKTPIDCNPDFFRNYVMEQVYPLYKLCTQVGSSLCKEVRDYITFLFLYSNCPLYVVIKTLEQQQTAKNLESFLKDYSLRKTNRLFSQIPDYEMELVKNFCPKTLTDYLLAVYKKRTPGDAQVLVLLCKYQLINNSLIQIFDENNAILTEAQNLALCLVSGLEYVEDTSTLGLNIHDFLKIHFSSNKKQQNTETLFKLLLDKNLVEIEKIPIYQNCMDYLEKFNFLNQLMLPNTVRIPIKLEELISCEISDFLKDIYRTDNDSLGQAEHILIEYLKMKDLINGREHESLKLAWEATHFSKLNY